MANTGVLNRGWVFRLEITPEQNIALLAQTDGRRGIWNMRHEWWQMSSSHHLPSMKDLDAVVRQGRKDIDWMAAVPAQAAQQVIRDYLGAWRTCWAGHGTVGAPRFRSRHHDRPSLDAPQARDLCITRISDKFSTITITITITITKIGRVTFRRHRAIPSSARITGATLSYSQGHWWIALRMQLRRPTPLPADRPPVGADRGITIPVALSDATFIDHPDWLTPAEKRRMLLLERRCARQRHHRWNTRGKKTPLGANETKTSAAITVLRERVARRRRDWQHNLSRYLANTYSAVAMEKLNIMGMSASASGTVAEPGTNVAQKRGLNRAIRAEAWSSLQQKTAYKVDEVGGIFATVRAAGTSTECHHCGSNAPGQRESQALFTCADPQCGWTGNADYNAALNIEHRAFGRATPSALTPGLELCPDVGLTAAARPGHTPGKPTRKGDAAKAHRQVSRGCGNNTQAQNAHA